MKSLGFDWVFSIRNLYIYIYIYIYTADMIVDIICDTIWDMCIYIYCIYDNI